MSEEIKTVETISVSFGKARILPNGDICTMTITQVGAEIHEILLTSEQARSLARTIRAKYGVDGQ